MVTALKVWMIKIHQISQVINELALSLKSSNPAREFPSTWEELIPPESYVSSFIRRNNLVLRRTMPLTLARAVLTVVYLKKWNDDLYNGFVSNPDFAERFKDARIFNQDETPIFIDDGKIKKETGKKQ